MNKTPPAPEAPAPPPPMIQPLVIQCRLPDSLRHLERTLENIVNQNNTQLDYLESIANNSSSLPTRAQMSELLSRTAELSTQLKKLEEMAQQAGKKKERRSLKLRLRLPRLYLPELDGPTVVTILMSLGALLMIFLSLGGHWSSLATLFR